MSPNPNVDVFVHHTKYYLEGADLHIIVCDFFSLVQYYMTMVLRFFLGWRCAVSGAQLFFHQGIENFS